MFSSLSLLELPTFPAAAVGLTALYLGVIIGCAEELNRLTTLGAEYTRKIVHIGSGNIILFAWLLDIPAWVGISASAIACCVAAISYFLPILPSINSVGRKSLGTFFYALSIGILIAWFWPLHQPQYAAIGILVMTWGDGLAAIVGQNCGRHPYQLWGINKSWEGSATMAVISFGATLPIVLSLGENLEVAIAIALGVAAAAAGLEAFSKWGIDNLTVPLGSATVGFWLHHLLVGTP